MCESIHQWWLAGVRFMLLPSQSAVVSLKILSKSLLWFAALVEDSRSDMYMCFRHHLNAVPPSHTSGPPGLMPTQHEKICILPVPCWCLTRVSWGPSSFQHSLKVFPNDFARPRGYAFVPEVGAVSAADKPFKLESIFLMAGRLDDYSCKTYFGLEETCVWW